MEKNWTRITKVSIGAAALAALAFVSVPAQAQDAGAAT
jgi:hypothetical protein